MGHAQPGLGLNFPSYNRSGHTWETSPLAPGQPFSSVQVCECVKRAGSAHTHLAGQPSFQPLCSSLGARLGSAGVRCWLVC